MVKAIIFDCFGVLTTEGWLPFKRKYFSHDPALEAEATDYSHRKDAGLIDYQEFEQAIATLANVRPETVKSAIEHNVADNDLFAFIAQTLKPHYKIGMLSNAGDDLLDRIFTKEQCALFDAVALSYETGYVKPSEQAYQIIAERLEVETNECIFVDDQERHCTAAREQGMHAIRYQNFDQFKTEISPLLSSQRP